MAGTVGNKSIGFRPLRHRYERAPSGPSFFSSANSPWVIEANPAFCGVREEGLDYLRFLAVLFPGR